jgi:hypothetical protein
MPAARPSAESAAGEGAALAWQWAALDADGQAVATRTPMRHAAVHHSLWSHVHQGTLAVLGAPVACVGVLVRALWALVCGALAVVARLDSAAPAAEQGVPSRAFVAAHEALWPAAGWSTVLSSSAADAVATLPPVARPVASLALSLATHGSAAAFEVARGLWRAWLGQRWALPLPCAWVGLRWGAAWPGRGAAPPAVSPGVAVWVGVRPVGAALGVCLWEVRVLPQQGAPAHALRAALFAAEAARVELEAGGRGDAVRAVCDGAAMAARVQVERGWRDAPLAVWDEGWRWRA